MYRYTPSLLTKNTDGNIETFDDLKANYQTFTKGMTEESCDTWLITDDKMQKAAKWLLSRLHEKKMIDLLDTYYQKALGGDVNAFKAFVPFSEKFFAKSNESQKAVFMKNVQFSDYDDEDEDEIIIENSDEEEIKL